MSTDTQDARSLGILAGNGTYPELLARCLLERGRKVAVARIAGQFNGIVPEGCGPVSEFRLGALEKTARFFLDNGAKTIFMAGGVMRKGAWRSARPDLPALKLIPKALLGGDDGLLTSVAGAFAQLGVEVGDPRPHIKEYISTAGLMAGPRPDAQTVRDIEVASVAAREIGSKDIGQSAVAYRGKVVAREGRRGTDKMLEGVTGSGAVMAKVPKPGQDLRFDMPAVGPSTGLAAHRAGIRAIALEEGGVLMLERERLFDICGDKGISLIGIRCA